MPRHVFTPEFYRPVSEDDYIRFVAVPPHSTGFLDAVYCDDVLVTQLDGDDQRWQQALVEPVTGTPTSSSSQPSLIARMLEALDVQDGHRVLEVGTGNGYHAALLCHRLGEGRVVNRGGGSDSGRGCPGDPRGRHPHIVRRYLQAADNRAVTKEQTASCQPPVARAIEDAVAEYEAGVTLEAVVARDADKLERLARPSSTATKESARSGRGSIALSLR